SPPGSSLRFPRLGREAAAAAAAAGGVRVAEGEARALHRAHVIDGHPVEVRQAESVHEEPHSVPGEDDVVLQGALFDVEAVLEARATAGQHADAEPRGLGGHTLRVNEPQYL